MTLFRLWVGISTPAPCSFVYFLAAVARIVNNLRSHSELLTLPQQHLSFERASAIMDFSNRMSQQFRSQTVSNGGRGKQQQNDSDAFMRLVRCAAPLLATVPLRLLEILRESYSQIAKLPGVSAILACSSRRKI